MFSVQDVVKAIGAPVDFEVLNLSEVSLININNNKTVLLLIFLVRLTRP